MQVPKALYDRREELEHRCEAAAGKVREAVGIEDRLCAELKGLVEAISVIEGAEEFLSSADPEKIEHSDADAPYVNPAMGQRPVRAHLRDPETSPAVSEPSPKRAPTARAPRAARRNVKEIVAGYLEGQPLKSFTKKELSKTLDLQGPQVLSALHKLRDEDRVQGKDDGGWWWVFEQPKVAQSAPENVVFKPASIIGFLEASPAGVSFEEAAKFGLAEALTQAEIDGEAWIDARGFYHLTVKAAPAAEQEAAE